MIPSPLARDAPTSIRRACPLCPEDMPELGPDERVTIGKIIYGEPELPHWEISPTVMEYSIPGLISWDLSCGHEIPAKDWVWISSTLEDSFAAPIFFWWVPRALYESTDW